jgi:membrane associated rhomboid family serine protease
LVRQSKVQLPADRPQILSTFVTTMFLHGGWFHLLGNMWFLWIFGNNIEDRLGHLSYLFFYLLGGILATACHWLTDTSSTVPVIGASGAVAAVLGAYAVTFPFHQIRCLLFLFILVTLIDVPALLVMGVWLLGQLAEGLRASRLGLSGGVAWWAHVGGFVAGAALIPWFGGLASADPRSSSLTKRKNPWEGWNGMDDLYH